MFHQSPPNIQPDNISNIFNMARNKKVVCAICCRVMRRDHLERHMAQHENGKFEEESFKGSAFSASTTLLESNVSSVSTTRSCKSIVINEEAVFKTIEMHAEDYERKMQLGEIVYKHVKDRGIPEESLPKEYKEAKDLYVKNKQNIDVENVILRPWQEGLLNYIKPSDREVIWVIGRKGNEGKSWFQEFLASKFGWSRVICGMDIRMKKSSICHILSKRSLMTTDIFLFDVGKAKTEEDLNYELLEHLKNGRTLAAKFDSKELKFHTPNIIIVFSNEKPDVGQMSKDRWKIFQIRDEELLDATEKYI
jgi:hypothetical protein